MREIPASIRAYIDGFDGEARERLLLIRETILEIVPEATEAIKYRMPTVVYRGNLAFYAAFKNHIGLYPMPKVIEKLKEELKPYKRGKGSIQFQHSEPLPLDLIRKIIRHRVEELR